MLFLLWGLINLVLIIGFFVLCFKATKLVRTHISNAAALLFVLGLLSFMTVSNKTGKVPVGRLQENFVVVDSTYSNQKMQPSIILEDNWLSRFLLYVTYHEKTAEKINKPTSAFTIINGLTLGTNWTPAMISFEETAAKNQYKYRVAGERDWNLLGFTLYQESKIFTGIVNLR